jgi:hypothetical protein
VTTQPRIDVVAECGLQILIATDDDADCPGRRRCRNPEQHNKCEEPTHGSTVTPCLG